MLNIVRCCAGCGIPCTFPSAATLHPDVLDFMVKNKEDIEDDRLIVLILDTDPSNAVLNSIVRSMDYIGIRHEVATLVYPDGQVRVSTRNSRTSKPKDSPT